MSLNYTPTVKSAGSLLLHGEIFKDNSGEGHVVTANGDVSTNIGGPIGGGYYSFDGTGDYLSIPNSDLLNFAAGKSVVEAYFYINSSSTVKMDMITKYSSSDSQRSWLIEVTTARTIRVFASANSSGTVSYDITTTTPLVTDTYHHVAWTRDGITDRIYINGVLEASHTTLHLFENTTNVAIGALDNSGGAVEFFDGFISEVLIIVGDDKGWTGSTIDVPTIPYTDGKTSLLLHGNDLNDYSGNNHATTTEGNASSNNSGNPFGYGGVYSLTGVDDRIEAVDSSDLDFGSDDFLMECFIRMNSTQDATIMSKCVLNLSEASFSHYRFTMDGRIDFYYSTDGSTQKGGQVVASGESFSIDTWYHVALARSDGDVRFYRDGVLKGTLTLGTDSLYNTTAPLRLGISITSTEWYQPLDGSIAEVRILKGSDGGFTGSTIDVPQSPYRYIQETKPVNTSTVKSAGSLLLHGEIFKDNSGNNHSVTVIGNTTSNPGGPIGGGYYDFDGVGDYLVIPDSDDWDFGSNDFVLSAIINPTNFTGNPMIFNQWVDGTHWTQFHLTTNGFLKWTVWNAGSVIDFIGTTSVLTGVWTHVALVRNVNDWYVYIDGVREILGINASAIPNYAGSWYVGALGNDTQNFTGSISEALVIKGSNNGWITPTIDAPTTPYVDGKTSLLLHGDDLSDYSGNNHVVTAVGDASANNSGNPFGYGGVYNFDGVGDNLNCGSFAFGTDDIAIDCFVKLNSKDPVSSTVWCINNYLTLSFGFYFPLNKVSLYVNGTEYSYIETLALDTWYHFVVSRSSDVWRVYQDGVLKNTNTNTGSIATNDFYMGSRSNLTDLFDGSITEIRILKGSDGGYTGSTTTVPEAPYKYDQEVKPIYTPTDSAYTKLLLHGNNLLDYSGNNHTIIARGDASYNNSGNPFGYGGVYDFDGTGDVLHLGNVSSLALNTSDFVVEGWINKSDATEGNLYTFNGNGTQPVQFYLPADGSIKIWGLTSFAIQSSTGLISVGIDYHIAFVRSGSEWFIFLNGTQVAYTATDARSLGVVANDITIAGYPNDTSPAQFFNGSITELRVLIGSDNGWTGSTIDVPTSPYKVV